MGHEGCCRAPLMSNSFPRDENAPDASGRDADETGRARRRVLIVDDDPVLVDSLRELLHEEGYAVEGFTDARVALARLRAVDGHEPA